MKQLISIVMALILSMMTAQAQENKGIIKETVIKRVTVRDTVVETKVISDVEEAKSVFQLEGNDQEEQHATMVTETINTTEVVQDEVTSDEENKAKIAVLKAQKQAELNASVEAEKAKAAKEKLILDQKKKELLEQMEANRKRLEKRPKKMAKLKKNNGN